MLVIMQVVKEATYFLFKQQKEANKILIATASAEILLIPRYTTVSHTYLLGSQIPVVPYQ